jgi:hypothetical protein
MIGKLHAPAGLPRGKRLRYPLDRRQNGPQSRSGRYGKAEILHPTRAHRPYAFGVWTVVSRYTDCSTAACIYHVILPNGGRWQHVYDWVMKRARAYVNKNMH